MPRTDALAAFTKVLDTTIANIALPPHRGDRLKSSDEAVLALTSDLVAVGIVITLSSWLADRLGRERYFIPGSRSARQ